MSPELEAIRLVTLHPALVHFTLGTLPLLVLAYAVAAWRRSTRWTFVADATLVVTAVLTLATVAFGLVSNAVLPWPGGLQLWRWLHLGLGAAGGALLVGFAAVRLARRRLRPESGRGELVAALAVTGVMVVTGWIGGEVLVFHAGMGVKAAGNGALAPTVAVPQRPPRDLRGSMHRLRASWSTATTQIASLVVEHPRPEHYRAVEAAAARLEADARWVAKGEDDDEHEGHAHPEIDVGLRFMAAGLADRARALEQAARAGQPAAVAEALGRVTAACAGCHQTYRWRQVAPSAVSKQ
jgi:cytochrome c556/uncharacterized membrane protein